MAKANFQDYIASFPCLRCKGYPSEVAHIRGFASLKTGDLLPRSHKTRANNSCIPLCPNCHRHAPDSIHAIGEGAFFDSLGRSRCWVFQWLASAIDSFYAEAA